MKTTNNLSRRAMLGGMAAASASILAGGSRAFADGEKTRMGLADFSYIVRQRKENKSAKFPRFANALEMLEHLHDIGLGGLQIGVGGWQTEFAKKLRERREKMEMYIEGQIGLPKNEAAVENFNKQIEIAKEAGASVIRTVFTGARRYEFFVSAEQFNKFKDDSWAALQLAAPVAAKQKIKLAIENHKDLRSEELVDYIKRIGSEWIGVNFDTGNNIALLEDAEKTTELLAPYTFTLHLKDMAVDEYEDGFLLSEVILGTGFLDLKKIVDTCRRLNPSAQFNLEMPARDPLKVPVFTHKYWATFAELPATQLADTLAMVRKRKTAALPRPSKLPMEEQLAFEEEQIVKSMAYAREKLGL
ncbi:MAG TPA: TIM barrel protein [Planctomycetota bacterium]|nr:TIM barrel protein [Planctomycetota bacterium]